MESIVKILYLAASAVAALWVYTKYFLERALLPPTQLSVTAERIGTVQDHHVIVVKIHLKNMGSATLVARNIRLDLRYITAETAGREGLSLFDGKRRTKAGAADAGTDLEQVKADTRPAHAETAQARTDQQQVEAVQGSPLAGRLCFSGSLVEDLKVNPASLMPAKVWAEFQRARMQVERVPTGFEEFLARVKGWLKTRWSQVLRSKPVRFFLREKEKEEPRRPKPRGFLILEHDTFVQPGIDQPYAFTTTLPSDTLCFLTWCSFEYAQKLFGWQKPLVSISRGLGLIHYTLQHANRPHTVEEVFWIADSPCRSGEPHTQNP